MIFMTEIRFVISWTILITTVVVANEYEICINLPDETILPNPNDMKQTFFVCQNGQPILHNCLPYTIFNTITCECDQVDYNYYDYNEFNAIDELLPPLEPITLPEIIITTTTTSAETSISTTITTTQTNENESSSPSCPCHDTWLPTYLTNQDRCDQYYMCYRGRALSMSCCLGHHWSTELKHCVPEYESTCTDKNSIIVQPECPDIGQAFYPHPFICEYFYYCENGHQSIQQCAAFYYWDCLEQKCIIKSEATCIISVPPLQRHIFYKM